MRGRLPCLTACFAGDWGMIWFRTTQCARLLTCLGVMAVAFTGCSVAEPPAAPAAQSAAKAPNGAIPLTAGTQRYEVKGQIKEIDLGRRALRILHEEIPGYMKRMTMEFEVRDESDLGGLALGDGVEFSLWVTTDDAWIGKLRRIASAVPSEATPAMVVSAGPSLRVGDLLLDTPLTNQLGRQVLFSQLRGQAFAFTFVFTTCPFPTMCPRMTSHFKEAFAGLSMSTKGRTNWLLFSITIDPRVDTPAVLSRYAEAHGSDPARWSYLTGEESNIEALVKKFGLSFLREGGAINHNLRTVVVGVDGRIRKIFIGNDWQPSALVEEMRRSLEMP